MCVVALFLLDDCHNVYLWVGCTTTDTDTDTDIDTDSVTAGTASTRFTAAKICAMRTTLSYCSGIMAS